MAAPSKLTPTGHAPSAPRSSTTTPRPTTAVHHHVDPIVRDVMSPRLVACEKSESCREVARKMREHDIGVLPVLENGRAVGVITDRDLVVRHVAEGGRTSERTPVGSLMTERVVSVRPSAPLGVALRAMKENGVRRLLVVEGEVPQGILTLDDILVRVGRSRDVGKVVDDVLAQYPLRHWP